MGPARTLTMTVLGLALACGPRALDPYGEVLVVVDTDLPVPRVASALRVDTYTLEGEPLESRDVALRDPRDFPASFSIQQDTDARGAEVLVRLRIHGDGGLDPLTTVDRLLHLQLSPGQRGRVRVVMRASCAGVAAELGPARRATCVEGEGTLEPIAVARAEPDLVTPAETLAGSAARAACPAVPSDRVCIEGGAFVLGVDDVQLSPDPDLPATPARIARVSTYVLDREEVTVARFRDALARGFVPATMPGVTEAELGADANSTCSFSAAPRGREDHALTCVSWSTARAFCMFLGGDLPTEAEWEHAATTRVSGKTMFPWGDEPPDCTRAVYGRLTLANLPGTCEVAKGPGPRSIAEAPDDRSAAGVHGLGGGVAEWTRTKPARYDDACFRPRDPACDGAGEAHVVRGGAWASTAINVRSTARLASANATSFIGFRCRWPLP